MRYTLVYSDFYVVMRDLLGKEVVRENGDNVRRGDLLYQWHDRQPQGRCIQSPHDLRSLTGFPGYRYLWRERT